VTNSIVAKRYAKALLELGRDDGNLEKYGQELSDMVGLLDESPELEQVLSNPGFELEDRKAVLAQILEKTSPSPMVANFYKLLMDRKRIGEIRGIESVYSKLIDDARGITRAEITSASALKDEEIQKLKDSLKAVAGREVQIEVNEDPSLIGGLKARIGDLVLDGSVKTQLESLKDSLRRGEYA
jgi:F-type H+-transporting ATPase subunit delta